MDDYVPVMVISRMPIHPDSRIRDASGLGIISLVELAPSFRLNIEPSYRQAMAYAGVEPAVKDNFLAGRCSWLTVGRRGRLQNVGPCEQHHMAAGRKSEP